MHTGNCLTHESVIWDSDGGFLRVLKTAFYGNVNFWKHFSALRNWLENKWNLKVRLCFVPRGLHDTIQGLSPFKTRFQKMFSRTEFCPRDDFWGSVHRGNQALPYEECLYRGCFWGGRPMALMWFCFFCYRSLERNEAFVPTGVTHQGGWVYLSR